MSGISVVICTYNGKSRLNETLHSIVTQKVNPGLLWELIVVDNASVDGTDEFVQNLLSINASHLTWKVVNESQQGLNYARTKGLKSAQYNYVLFCDDDNILDANYLQFAFDLVQKYPSIGVLGGHGIPLFEGAKPEWWNRYCHSYAVGAQADADGKIQEIPAEVYGAGAIVRRLPLLNLFDNGFQTIMTDRKKGSLVSGGDVEWCYLLQLLGYEIWYSSKLQFQHTMPTNRLEWAYYLKLKEGIASGVALLSGYEFILKNKRGGVAGYVFFYGKRFLRSFIALSVFRLKMSLNKYYAETADLGSVTLTAKYKSYQLNVKRAVKHYLQLKNSFIQSQR
ncbi:MAG: glycosyltransferase family 2 protein [Bacteroidetes bacterium]|nr:glycosyltransferase family 2 protein [Bacteroidota bacterium]